VSASTAEGNIHESTTLPSRKYAGRKLCDLHMEGAMVPMSMNWHVTHAKNKRALGNLLEESEAGNFTGLDTC